MLGLPGSNRILEAPGRPFVRPGNRPNRGGRPTVGGDGAPQLGREVGLMSQATRAGRGRYRVVAALGVAAVLVAGCSGGGGGGGNGNGGGGGQGGTGKGGGDVAPPKVAVQPA